MTRLESEIKDEIENEKANVIVTVFTDGEENSSVEWRDFSKLKAMMDRLRESRMWTFTLIGCDEGTLDTARDLGLDQGSVLRYASGSAGTQRAFKSLDAARSRYTSGVISASLMRSSGDEAAFDTAMDHVVGANFFNESDADAGEDSTDTEDKK